MAESQEIDTANTNAGSHSQQSLGEVLAAARNAKKLSQQDVSNSLRFSVKQIDALENNAFDLLPEAMIVRGFIRNYARLLEIDAEPLLASYRAGSADDSSTLITVQSSMPPVLLTKDSQPWLKYILGSILVLLFLLAWLFYVDYMPKITNAPVEKAAQPVAENKSVSEVPLPEIALPAAEREAGAADIAVAGVAEQVGDVPVASNQTESAALAAPVPPPSAAQDNLKPTAESKKEAAAPKETEKPKEAEKTVPQQPAVPANVAAGPADKKVSMTFSEQTWISIADKSGKVIYEKMARNGDVETFSGKPPFNLVIGNAKATKLSYAGQDIDLAAYTKNNVARVVLE